MISASHFDTRPSDYDRTGAPYYAAEIPRKDWGVIGSEYNSVFEHTTVLWLSTVLNRRPSDRWLSKSFPSASGIVTGFGLAFEEYRKNWCGEEMRSVMLDVLENDKREAFLKNAWLPFINISEIRINPDERAISFRCSSVTEEYNLSEHGIVILKHNDNWEFGYSSDDSQYFEDWTGATPNHRLRFAWQRFWNKLTGRRALFDGGDIVIIDSRTGHETVLRRTS